MADLPPTISFPTDREIRALMALQHDEYFKTIVDWILGNLENFERQNVVERDQLLFRWNQGRIQILKELEAYLKHPELYLQQVMVNRQLQDQAKVLDQTNLNV